ncbi:MAG: glycosyl hydrolase, partial [Planctomycetota bacterium]
AQGQPAPGGTEGQPAPAAPPGRYLVARVVRAPDSPWHGGRCYVDLLRPGVTEKFLEITLGAYEREIGGELGKRIPGIFTDEPHILPAGGLPWTDSLPEAFERRWGYSLLDHLPALVRPLGDWRRVRHDTYRLLLELFVERWAKPYFEACERAGLEFTGHYWEHEWPRCLLVPDNMALYAWHQRPAIDILMNQYDEGTHAQFGNVRAVRELSSVANQLGRRRTLCEAYGAAGWELRFADMKRIADWLFALGVNTVDEHLSYLTIRGARKRDHPQSFSYHEPWWDDYEARALYAARLSAALSQGDQVQSFLVIEPTTTAWFYQADPSCAGRLEKLGAGFQDFILRLERAQVEYDIGCEDLIERHGSVLVRRLKIGKRAYRATVIPPQAENLASTTLKLLEELSATGGTVYFCGDPPPFVDGRPAPWAEAGPGAAPRVPSGWERIEPEKLPAAVDALQTDGFSIRRAPGDQGILFHHRRRLSDAELVCLANASDRAPSAGTVASPAEGAERWDLEAGKAVPIAFRRGAGKIEIPFELPPAGSLLVFLSWEPKEPAPDRKLAARARAPRRPPPARRGAPPRPGRPRAAGAGGGA